MEGCRLGLQREAVVAGDIFGENVEKIDPELDDGAAIVADQVVVMMSALHEVEHGRPGGELNRLDDADLGEAFECPIHGGLVEDRIMPADDLDDVGRSQVMFADSQHGLDDQSS